MADEFVRPNFLEHQTVNEILSRMLAVLPENISKEENGWVCDLFFPVAIEKAKAVEFILTEAIKNLVPKYSYGEILKEHAANRGIIPKPAQKAEAVLSIKGKAGTVIPEGYSFSTSAQWNDSNILFTTLSEHIIPQNEMIDIKVQCQTAGKRGNVAAETILLMAKPIKGILSVRNNAPATGGFDEESEESIRKRVLEYDQSQGESFVGSPADYKRWAKEINGVGGVKVISAQDDTGLVTLILTDENGDPASETICRDVYNYIMSPQEQDQRLAPCNAFLNVIPPDKKQIYVTAAITVKNGYGIEGIKKAFVESLVQYFKTENALDEIKYTEIGSILIQTEGVSDYKNLKVNDTISNITIEQGEMPIVDSTRVVFTL